MSRQQKRAVGRYEFRRFPYIELEPLPEVDISSYVSRALGAKKLGSRLANPWNEKPFTCRKTGKTYMFWDNYMKHVDEYSPLCGPAADEAMKIYRSPYDERTFHFRQNLKLHNKVKRFEEHEETLVMKRIINNHPNETSDSLGVEVTKKNVGSRFLKKPEKTLEDELQELRNERRKQGMINAAADVVGIACNKEDKLMEKETSEEKEDIEKLNKNINMGPSGCITWKPTLKWPENYDDLPPIERPKPAKRPLYYGWTHSDDVDSWYLEDHTPGSHKHYSQFYENLYGKKAICPRLWDTVFPETERHVSTRKSVLQT